MSKTLKEMEEDLRDDENAEAVEMSFGGSLEDLERNQKMIDEDETDTLDRWYSSSDKSWDDFGEIPIGDSSKIFGKDKSKDTKDIYDEPYEAYDDSYKEGYDRLLNIIGDLITELKTMKS